MIQDANEIEKEIRVNPNAICWKGKSINEFEELVWMNMGLNSVPRSIKLNFKKILGAILVFEACNLLINSYILCRDYQDSWILLGLELFYYLFIVTYIIYFYYEDKIEMLLLFALITRFTMILLPNIKYVFFLGRSIDQHNQYNLANFIIENGRLAKFYEYRYDLTSQYYLGVPLLHLSMAIFSVVTNIPLFQTFKILPVFWNMIYPLLTYFIIKNFSKKFNNNFIKCALFMSSIPISTSLSYILTGSLFTYIFFYLILSQLVILIESPILKLKNVMLFIFFTSVSILSHSIQVLHFLGIITVTMIIIRLNKRFKISSSIYNLIFITIIMDVAWIVSQITPVKLLKDFLKFLGASESVTPTFFALYKINILATVKTIILHYGADIFITFLMLLGIYYMVSKKDVLNKYGLIYVFLIYFTLIILGLTVVGIGFGISYNYWARVFRLLYLIYPFLYSIFLYELISNRYRKYVMLILFSLIVVFSSIQFYKHPAFIPPASSLSDKLPSDEPIVYKGNVNSIFQRNMIYFAEERVVGRIACDAVTRNQIIGLTDKNFSRNSLTWYYPPNRILYPDMEVREYQYFLIHLPGPAGSFEEKAFVRVTPVILNQIYSNSHNVVYSNGESFILYFRNDVG